MAVKKNTQAEATPPAEEAVVETAAEPETQAPKTVKKAPEKSEGFCVYIGPSIPGVIQSGSVYRGNREKALKALAPIVEARPLVAALLVDGATLSADRIKVNTPGNLLYVNYHRLAAGEIK